MLVKFKAFADLLYGAFISSGASEVKGPLGGQDGFVKSARLGIFDSEQVMEHGGSVNAWSELYGLCVMLERPVDIPLAGQRQSHAVVSVGVVRIKTNRLGEVAYRFVGFSGVEQGLPKMLTHAHGGILGIEAIGHTLQRLG